MKRITWLLVLYLCLAISGVAWADRIQELTETNQRIDQEIMNRKNEIAQLMQVKVENIGRIKELQKIAQDKIAAERIAREVAEEKVRGK